MRRTPERTPLVLLTGLAVALVALWALARPAPELQQTRRRFADLQAQVVQARATKEARAADRGRVLRLRAQARAAAEPQRAALEAEAVAIESRIGWGRPDEVRAIVTGSPLLTVRRAVDTPSDVVPVSAGNSNGCVACHQAIASPGFEQYPAPFRTHPILPAYVGADSPHPPSRVRCASCHQGDGTAEDFASAGHARIPQAADAVPASMRPWRDPEADGAMLPVGRTEAGCVACHAGEVHQPGAPGLNDALLTLDRGGCYTCHDVPGLDPAVRRGPDLRRINGKLDREWVRRWLADPRAIKPATWMPRFWGSGQPSADDRTEIDAIVAYLFANGGDYVPAVAAPPKGDAARGKELVAAVGCLGCHVVGETSRDVTSARRTFGQPLQAIAGKASYAWLVDWVRDPSRYSPGTRMPNLRLTEREASDVASYLETLTSAAPAMPAPAVEADEPFRVLLGRSRSSTAAPVRSLTGDALRVAAGKAAIQARGCFNCHEIRGFEGQRTVVPLSTRRVWQPAHIGTLHAAADAPGDAEAAARNTVDYAFGEAEREHLALALTAVAGPVRDTHALSTPWHTTKVAGRALVQRRNCVGCHVIDGTGGDVVKLVAEPSLGPPLLTPEGSRVQREWLHRFLRQPSTIRPWLAVRMPTFGLSDDEIEVVGGYFRGIAPENPKPSPAPPGATAAAGRELFDLLKCQQCHVLGDIPKDQPTSNLAPDLRMARERLQPEWVLAWLRNPSAILPGTRMPTFWPDYPKSFYPPLERDGAAQIRAIREHLLTLR